MRPNRRLIEIFYKAATSSRLARTLLTPVGLVVFSIFILIFVFVPLAIDKFLEFPKLIPLPFNIILSTPFLITGIFLILWSVFHFIKVRGTPVPFNPPPKLVTTGPYAHVRNPMISGWFIILFGLGIFLRSISIAFIFTPLFILFCVLELKTVEELELEKRLGNDYVEYKRRVPMFFPRIKVEKNW